MVSGSNVNDFQFKVLCSVTKFDDFLFIIRYFAVDKIRYEDNNSYTMSCIREFDGLNR